MIRGSAFVRVGCVGCGNFFDVDLITIREKRGADYSLVDASTSCRLTRCRGRGYFIAAPAIDANFLLLVNPSMDALRGRLEALRPVDLEPPEQGPPPPAVEQERAA